MTYICVQNFMKFHRETKELDTTKVLHGGRGAPIC